MFPDKNTPTAKVVSNITMPRAWSKGAGCIAHDVAPISTAYFHEQMTDFRTFMGEAETQDIDAGWKSLCFQYESLLEDPHKNGVHDRFYALACEWSMRKRMYEADGSEAIAKAIARSMLSNMA